ncbi:hypothetical protein IB286_12665 [Spongiibacter sp. KMU-158]|uniref:Uncharacterized protein n=1 Tax=Spongiibacter pelagi TaxID=2760804 RepID=A0A927C4Q7_9GAMM|nr:hypothetical protein [Spongiibacter pelagi]MBD2859857.1 hypothetical protein [Spongiibacter pelagi]
MSRPHKNKKSTKSKKLRMILEYWPGRPLKRANPAFSRMEKKWQGLIMRELLDGTIEEFSISPETPIFLDEFLSVLQEQIGEIASADDKCCGLRIYARA